MDRVDALKELLAKVEAGEATYDDFTELHLILDGNHGRAFEAYKLGSLDAAKALHDAVLGGWEYGVTLNYEQPSGPCAFVAEWGGGGDEQTAQSTTPARAWLIAIIKALIATTTPPR